MQVAVLDYQGKARELSDTLLMAGHEVVSAASPADVFLCDHDYAGTNRLRLIQAHKKNGAKVFLYSHGANPNLGWDGIWTPSELVDGYLAMNEGQKEVMKAYGYPRPIHVIGWHYCPIRPFKKSCDRKGIKILFAPWHPHDNNWLIPEAKELNGYVLRYLVTTYTYAEITCRFVHGLAYNGIEQYDEVKYISGGTNATDSIDASDLVIAHGTLAYLAVARGVPTVMMGQEIRPHESYFEDHRIEVKNWEKYKDLMWYPYPIIDPYVFDKEPVEWKSKFIGKPFDRDKFIRIVEKG